MSAGEKRRPLLELLAYIIISMHRTSRDFSKHRFYPKIFRGISYNMQNILYVKGFMEGFYMNMTYKLHLGTFPFHRDLVLPSQERWDDRLDNGCSKWRFLL